MISLARTGKRDGAFILRPTGIRVLSIRVKDLQSPNSVTFSKACLANAALTKIGEDPELNAEGRPEIRDRTLNVQIPKGVHQGQQIRLAKQGGAGIGSGEKGDLFLEIEFAPHPLHHVEDKNVYLDLPVAPWIYLKSWRNYAPDCGVSKADIRLE